MANLNELSKYIDMAGKPGDIPVELTAFILFLKQEKRQIKNTQLNAFAINAEEINQLAYCIQLMMMECKESLRFQIALANRFNILNHWSFLEFNFTVNNDAIQLDIFVCDPLGFSNSIYLANQLSQIMEFGDLSKYCDLTVYLPTDTLQDSGRSCAYFTLDNIFMLSNQNEYDPIYKYMKHHQDTQKNIVATKTLEQCQKAVSVCYEKEQLEKIYNFDIITSSLPTRLLRTQHGVSNLENTVLKTDRSKEIVNHKNDSALISIKKHFIYIQDHFHVERLRNLRVNLRMNHCGTDMQNRFASPLTEKDVLFFNESVTKHRIDGLKLFIQQHIDKRANASTSAESRPSNNNNNI